MNENHESINKLRSLNLLDSGKEAEFESIAEIATCVFDVPISMVTFLDEERQWFKATRGVGDITEASVKTSFCIHTVNEADGLLIVKDARKDPRFINNPYVKNTPNFQFYAGVSITTADNYRIGTICIYDFKPRELNTKQIKCLKLLAQYTNKLIDIRASNQDLKHQRNTLATINKDLKQYAYAIAHDIKAPLRVMSTFSSFLIRDIKHKLNKKELEYLNYITKSAKELSNYTQNLLHFSESIQTDTSHAMAVDLNDLINSIDALINNNKAVSILFDNNLTTVFVSEVALRQILQNLISNSIRYRKKNIDNPFIIISVSEIGNKYQFKVTDNGIGIKKEQLKNIFKLFRRDKMNKESTGIGLNVVKRIVDKMAGTIAIESTEGHGTEISFTIPKILNFM